jgi:hypothetical protein
VIQEDIRSQSSQEAAVVVPACSAHANTHDIVSGNAGSVRGA